MALLFIYWFWIEPRHMKERVRAVRFRRALESEITRGYKDNPDNRLTIEGERHAGAPDFERRTVYERAGISDLFEPITAQGVTILKAKLDQGWELWNQIEAHGLTDELRGQTWGWEEQTREAVQLYIRRGPIARLEAWSFARRPFTSGTDDVHRQLGALRFELRTVERFVKHLEKQVVRDAQRLDA